MFHNFQAPPDILLGMQNSEFKFHLTGSTYFRGAGKDLDFFVEDSNNIRSFLQSLGFKRRSSNYIDCNCIEVWRKDESIDVQIVYNAELKQRVQEKFKNKGIINPTTEQWDLAFAMFS